MAQSVRVQSVRERSLFAGYLVLQAALAIVWWCAMAVSPTVRAWFELVPDKHQALNSFLLADLVMFVGGSLVSAWGVVRREPWAVALTAFTAGGITYATLYLVGWVAITGAGPAGVLPMAAATAATAFIAYRVWRDDLTTG